MSDAQLSVALCTYNGARFLSEQLESIAAQSTLPHELVICDDCSSDSTVEIIREFAAGARFPVSLRVNDSRLGSTKNFEKAISLCQFEIVALCDQDDVWHPQKLSRMAGAFHGDERVGAVFSDAELIDENSQCLGSTLWDSNLFNKREQKKFESGDELEVLLKHTLVTGATMAFRSRFRNLVLPIPAEQIHDLWITMLIASVAHLAPLRHALIRYRRHEAQQIGPGEELTFWQKVPRRVGPDYYLSEATRLGEICERLHDRRALFAPHPNALYRIRQKIRHRKARAEFPSSRVLRLPSVIREVATLRYWRYSSGVGSVAKDLLA
jgi:glycosyltransferase involved in cell wall biosynthesis